MTLPMTIHSTPLRIQKNWRSFYNGQDLSVYISCRQKPVSEGKFLVGVPQHSRNSIVIIFDDTAEFHADIAEKYEIRPRGGGWLIIDQGKRAVHITGTSEAFGRELDRRLTYRAIGAAFPGFSCTVDM